MIMQIFFELINIIYIDKNFKIENLIIFSI